MTNNDHFLLRVCSVLGTVLSTKNFTYDISIQSSQQLCEVGIATPLTNKEAKALEVAGPGAHISDSHLSLPVRPG